MSLKSITLETLATLDGGKAAEAFRRHLHRATADCYDRPADDHARKVTMEVLVQPVMDPSGGCTEAKIQIKVSSAVPKHQTKVYSAGLRPNGTLLVNEDSLDAIDQGTLLPNATNEE